MKKKTTEQFIKDAKKIHGNKYDYSLVKYINNNTLIEIICKKHGIFKQTPSHHLRGCNCLKCRGYLKTNEEFIKTVEKFHGKKYDYSLVEYIDSTTNVKIICHVHGVFEQIPKNHRIGHGCPKCVHNYKLTLNEFIKRSKKIHGEKYNYSLVKYKNMYTKVDIICKKHGIFKQIPDNHIRKKYGCPKCNESKGEKEIRNILEKSKIIFESQKRFKECKNINVLPFDFYLPKENICIEFDGKQHFRSVDIWGGKKEFKNIQKRDRIKNEYCKNNNIRLLRIKYDDSIEEKINTII